MHKKLWNKDFILLLQANAVSSIGDLMYSVAIGYWVYEQTGSSGLMGLMSAISMAVFMVLSPFAGGIADKTDRKKIMVGMDIMQSVIMVAVGILAWLDLLNVPGVLITAFLTSVGSALYSPAVSTLMLDIIPHDDMVRGQSIHSGIMTLINLTGNAFSGAMVAFFGVPLIVVVNGLSNLYSAFSELFIRVPKTMQQGEQVTVKSLLSDSKTAIRTIFAEPFLRLFIPSALIINLLGTGPMSLALPMCMEKGFSVEAYGLLMSINTAGSLICVLLLGIIKLSPNGRFWAMGLGFVGSVCFYLIAYLSGNFSLVAIGMFVGTFLNGAGNTIFNASMMLALPEENRGAILGFVNSACIGGSALSALVYGLLGDLFPLYIIFTIGGVISMIPMVYLCFHPKTKGFILTH